jgi:chaperone modulatory protein CbpM
MVKHQLVIASFNIEANPELTLDELCSACNVTPEFVEQLVEYGIIELDNEPIETHRFEPEHLRRVRTIVHLQRDLEVNLPGAAVVIDLMDEIEEMRAKIEMMERHLFF